MKLWLDDARTAPEGWVHVTTTEECIAKLATGEVEMVSLDNDLGWLIDDGYIYSGERRLAPEGYTVVEWMVENNVWPEWVSVHSNNVVAAKHMQQMIETHGNYGRKQFVEFHVEDRARRLDVRYPAVGYARQS